jgi:hypothetical protein
MATFHFLDDGFTGRIGTLVGSSYEGTLYVKRYHKPSNPNSQQQQEIRGLFREIGEIGRQVRLELYALNCGKVKTRHVINHLMQINHEMFSKATRHQSKDGVWDRWTPALFQFANGTLSPVTITKAEIQTDPTSGVRELGLKFDPPAGTAAYEGYAFVFDDNSNKVIVRKVKLGDFAPDKGMMVSLAPFANMSSYQNIHVYLAYVDGKLDEGQAIDPMALGRNASTTAYKRAAVASQSAPSEAPTNSEQVPTN